ncbi:MAG: type IVB secretion system protein IcmH/DotU [Lamprobacter sp.]|uniref:type IVB secretion system protein IcmH/DotU n=1 Tax=Lamprobacter sp. TaxID=3100796 RepID=UPI002B261BE8|nr:type IVB secretion system protein IcmH/DotU [Lamprobacter sp.]MEA3640543.1 type IVB secretion system protein IcmH/DotU [Lamprobacter sp.]
MSNQDSSHGGFSDDPSKTIVRPRPGFRPPADAGSLPSQEFEHRRSIAPAHGNTARVSGEIAESTEINPLIAASSPLLFRASAIRNTATQNDVYGLRDEFVSELTAFDHRARALGHDGELLSDARYALSTFVDEAVLNTPWGSQSKWQEDSLLSTFFNETWGGDRFFVILDRAKQQPGRNLALLELLFVCLMLGFQGKFHVLERGRARLDEVIDDLYQVIRGQRGDVDRDLSPHWRGVETTGRAVSNYLPLWVLAAIAGALLVSIYLSFRFAISGAAYPVFDHLSVIGRDRLSIVQSNLPEPVAEVVVPEVVLPPQPKLRLAENLKSEINSDLLSVEQDGMRSMVRIKSDTLFRSGSADVEDQFLPILERISKAINDVPGRIVIVGHSDNIPIKTARFPSNWELSRMRAVNVMTELGRHLDNPERMAPEGRADTEPVAPNDTKANRALNRRVEIYVYEQEQL